MSRCSPPQRARDEAHGGTDTSPTAPSPPAALPSAVKHLVPEPYRSLDDEIVEQMYASCMSKTDNVFDMKGCEKLCDEQVQSMNGAITDSSRSDRGEQHHDGRRILMGDHYWTVVSRQKRPLKSPFDPPPPFSQRLSELRPNSRIKVSNSISNSFL